MEASKLKNMVVLKNLPSNLVEEAIVVLKSSKKVKKLEKIEKNKSIENIAMEKRDKDYVVKEAEMLVSGYISKIEDNHDQKQNMMSKNNKKYIRLKKYAMLSSMVIVVQTILLFLK